jgi:hypothetical protein
MRDLLRFNNVIVKEVRMTIFVPTSYKKRYWTKEK